MKNHDDRLAGQTAFLGAVCWLTYFSIYFGRLNFSASMSEILRGGIWRKGQLGSVAAAFYLAYGLGQLPSGLLGDRLSPKRMVFVGLLGTALANSVFPSMKTLVGMQAVWFLNGLLQAMIWPPMVRLVTDLAGTGRSVNIILLLSFSSPAGMLFAYLVSAVLLKTGSWEPCFWSAGIWLAGIAALWILSVTSLERSMGRIGSGEAEKVPGQADRKKVAISEKRKGLSLSMLAACGILWLTGAAFIHGILKDGLTTWIPTYLTEEFAVSPSFSVLLTTLLPVVNLCGVPIAQMGNRRVFRNEAAAGVAFYLAALGSIVGMMSGIGSSLYGMIVLFAIVTSMMTAVNTLLISFLPLHFQKEGRVATVSGALNAVTYLGSAAASALFGYTTEYSGWKGTQLIWCLCGGAGMLFCLIAVRKWGRNRKNIYEEEQKNENDTGVL